MDPLIPEDLQQMYFYASMPGPDQWSGECVKLIERIARLEQERDELKRTVEIQAMAIYERNGDVNRALDEVRDLKAQVARLREPVSDEEWKRYSIEVTIATGKNFVKAAMMTFQSVGTLIASRAKEASNGTDQ